MNGFRNALVGSPLWDPHGHCFLWDPPLLWLLVVANILIALAYFSIPFALVVIVRRRRDLLHRWVFWAFAAFILGCGLTHAVYVATIWTPVYWVQGSVDGLTALASAATALALWRLLPRIIALPDQRELRKTNEELRAEVEKRQRAEERARRSEERFRTLLESAPDGIVVTDGSGTIQLVNSAVESLFEYHRDELIGQPVEVLVPEELRGAHEAHRKKYMENPVARPMGIDIDLQARKKDGKLLPVEVSLSPLQDPEASDNEPNSLSPHEGSGDSIVSVIRDSSPRKRYERELKSLTKALEWRNTQLEAINSEMKSFTYSVSHDLRSPLRAVEGFARILAKEAETSISEKGAHALDRIRRNTAHMNSLIEDLLSLSRLGQQALDTKQVDMNEMVSSALSELTEERRAKNPEIRIGDLPACNADPGMLQQVFVNLIGNAIKYSRDRENPYIEVGASLVAEEYVYYVRDNGAGFDPEYADQLFGAFQRLHSAEEFEGTGVGLAIVQRIINRHGGRIWAEGHIDNGAAFYFTLPSRTVEGREPG